MHSNMTRERLASDSRASVKLWVDGALYMYIYTVTVGFSTTELVHINFNLCIEFFFLSFVAVSITFGRWPVDIE